MTRFAPPVNIRKMKGLIAQCGSEEEYIKTIKRGYRFNPIEFVHHFGIRESNGVLTPYKLFPKQELFIRWVNMNKAHCHKELYAVTVKEVGSTTAILLYLIHQWLFGDELVLGIGVSDSKKLGNTYWPFIKKFLSFLPEYFLPDDFDFDTCLNYNELRNEETGSLLLGENRSTMGRTGYADFYVIDGFTDIKFPKKVKDRMVEGSKCCLYMSKYAPMTEAGKIFLKDTIKTDKLFKFNWKDFPGRDHFWYDRARKGISKERQHIELNGTPYKQWKLYDEEM